MNSSYLRIIECKVLLKIHRSKSLILCSNTIYHVSLLFFSLFDETDIKEMWVIVSWWLSTINSSSYLSFHFILFNNQSLFSNTVLITVDDNFFCTEEIKYDYLINTVPVFVYVFPPCMLDKEIITEKREITQVKKTNHKTMTRLLQFLFPFVILEYQLCKTIQS